MFDDDQKSAILMIKKNNKLEWEQLRKSYDKYSSVMLMITEIEIDLDQWNTLIDEVKGDAEGNRSQIISLADGYDNNARISTYRYSSWETYKKSLENKHWSQQSIQNIEDQAHYVLTVSAQ